MRKAIKNIYEFGCFMSVHNIAAYSASIAFFIFLSLFPTLMFICSLVRFFPITENDILNAIYNIVPNVLDGALTGIVDELFRTSLTVLPISAIASLWTASLGFAGLIRGLNGVLDIKEKRNYFKLRLVAILYTLLLVFVVILTILLIGVGASFRSFVITHVPFFLSGFKRLIFIRNIFVVGLLMLFFLLCYTFLPCEKQRFIVQFPGAIIASLGWIFITRCFGYYIEYINGFSVYGSMITVALFLTWMYFCFYVVLAGATFNKYYNKQVDYGLNRMKSKRNSLKDARLAKKNNKNAQNIDNTALKDENI